MVVVKSHGGTDAVGFANAIGVAVDMIARDLNGKIAEELAHIRRLHQQTTLAVDADSTHHGLAEQEAGKCT